MANLNFDKSGTNPVVTETPTCRFLQDKQAIKGNDGRFCKTNLTMIADFNFILCFIFPIFSKLCF